MPRRTFMLLPLLLTVLFAACAGGATTGQRSANRNLLDYGDIQGSRHTTALELIQELRPHWLEVRRAGSGLAKRVYLGDLSIGGVETLRQISLETVETLHYYDGPAAAQRWGPDHSAGVIQVRTRTP